MDRFEEWQSRVLASDAARQQYARAVAGSDVIALDPYVRAIAAVAYAEGIAKYRRLRQHVRKDGVAKSSFSMRAAELEADRLTEIWSAKYEPYLCWCGDWHVGRLREPDGAVH